MGNKTNLYIGILKDTSMTNIEKVNRFLDEALLKKVRKVSPQIMSVYDKNGLNNKDLQ